jgi:hypothetical protein
LSSTFIWIYPLIHPSILLFLLIHSSIIYSYYSYSLFILIIQLFYLISLTYFILVYILIFFSIISSVFFFLLFILIIIIQPVLSYILEMYSHIYNVVFNIPSYIIILYSMNLPQHISNSILSYYLLLLSITFPIILFLSTPNLPYIVLSILISPSLSSIFTIYTHLLVLHSSYLIMFLYFYYNTHSILLFSLLHYLLAISIYS